MCDQGYHRAADKDYSLLRYDAMMNANLFLTFPATRCLHLQGSRRRIRFLENWLYYTRKSTYNSNYKYLFIFLTVLLNDAVSTASNN
jgi:hypothetical protein